MSLFLDPKPPNVPSTDRSSRIYGSARTRSELPSSEALRISPLPAREFPGWIEPYVLCYALLRDATHYGRQPAFLWPGRLVTGLRGSVHGREQGFGGGCLDDLSDARSSSRCPGQPCYFGPAVRCVLWTSIAMDERVDPTRLRPLRRAARERATAHKTHTAIVGEVRGARLGKRLPRLGAGLGKKRDAAR